MKLHLSRVLVLVGGVAGASVVAGAVAVGCNGDDASPNNEVPDGSSGPNTDSTTDAFEHPETDSGDAGLKVDSAAPDGATGDGDSGDGGDGAQVDGQVGFDAATLLNFPNETILAYCSRLQQCCLVSTGSWNEASCVSALQSGGGIRGLGNYVASLDSGTVDYNASAAASCLADIAAIPCGVLTSVTVLNIQSDCYGAFVGTLPTDGGPCKTSVECVAGDYCSAAQDGGVCVPVHGVNGACTRTLDDECSYLGTGVSTFCDLDGGVGQCHPTEAIEAGCTSNAQCQSGLCGGTTCATQEVLTDPGVPGGTCDFFTIKDAGGGG